MTPEQVKQALHEREYYVSLIFDKERLLKRWKEIGYEPKPMQIKLEI